MKAMLAILLILAPLSHAQETAPPLKVSYAVDVTKPAGGAVPIEMTIENNRDEEITVGIPTWAPGSYRIVDYYKAIQDLTAKAGGKDLAVSTTTHTSLWKIKTGGAAKVTVGYTLKPGAVASMRNNLSATHYELQGPSAYLFVQDHMKGPHQVTFKLPEGWKVGTGLTKKADMTYEARDYDTFIDCPTELGAFDLYSYKVDETLYEVVVHTTGEINSKGLVDVLKKISAEQMKIFGGAPFERYVWIFHLRSQMGGAGLEHLNSTHIAMPIQFIQADVKNIASISSHEFFHLWNVKRIRPVELGPFDYTKKVPSKALWLSEGGTSYYGDRSLVRAQIWDEKKYFDHLCEEIKTLQDNPARLTQSAEEASRTIWDRKMEDPTPRIDYYNKGEVLTLLMDLKIRTITKGKKSFDDVMRLLYQKNVVEGAKAGKGPIGVGFEEDGIVKAVTEISGTDFTDFFKKYVAGVEELPYDEVFKAAGLNLAISKGKALGLAMAANGLRVARVPVGSEAEKAGVKTGDRLKTINGVEVKDREGVQKELEKAKVGEKLKVEFTRGEETVEFTLPVQERDTGAYKLTRSADLADDQKALLNGWVGKPTY